ncbi:LytR/AlgR family response regulator transcription factor [Aquirufa sp. TARAVU-A1A]|jgi:two-component system LytT family response regulator
MKTTLKLPDLQTCLIADVLFIEGKSNYSIIYTTNADPITMAKTLKKFESQLRLHPFLRIHKSYLINQAHLTSQSLSPENTLQLSNGTILPVSRRKREQIKKSL